jgi:hypothetical protein
MLFGEKVVVCCENHAEHRDTLYGQNAKYWCVKRDGIYSKTKLHGLSPRANYNDRATAACWRSDCQLLRIEGATWSA